MVGGQPTLSCLERERERDEDGVGARAENGRE